MKSRRSHSLPGVYMACKTQRFFLSLQKQNSFTRGQEELLNRHLCVFRYAPLYKDKPRVSHVVHACKLPRAILVRIH